MWRSRLAGVPGEGGLHDGPQGREHKHTLPNTSSARLLLLIYSASTYFLK